MLPQLPSTTTDWASGACDSVTFDLLGETLCYKLIGADTQGRFALIERRAPPHFRGTDVHWHATTTEVVYMLDGILAVTLGNETTIARPGTAILVPPRLVHTYWNPSASPAVYLTLLFPSGHEQYCQALASMIATATTWPPADMRGVWALAERYDVFGLNQL